MPIRVQDELPAVNFLRNENVFVMTTTRATTQEIRPLKVLILNLMPKKIETENQFLRLLSNSPLQLDIQLLRIDARESRNTPAEHLNNFYCNFEDICDQNFDGLIVTGAPLGLVEFNDVAYWPQIKQVLEWAKDHVTSTLFVCWAVQAALNILYGIPKQTRSEKISGVYEHHILQPHALLTRGFDDSFLAPHSRYADFPAALIRDYTDLEILAETEEGDAYLFASKDKRIAFVTGHPEYDANTPPASSSAMWKRASIPVFHTIISRKTIRRTNRAPPAKPWQSTVYQLAELLRLPDHAIRSTPYESDSGLIFYTTRS